MEKLIKPFRAAFCIGLIGMVVPLAIYGSFEGDFIPDWPHMPFVPFWVALFAVLVSAASLGVLFSRRPRATALLLGALLLAAYLFGYVTYDIFINPEHSHLIGWAGGLTELALMGGAFIIAGSLPAEAGIAKYGLLRMLNKIVPLGPVFFCITMILYGLMHFVYPQMVATLVPAWIPWHLFWTYLAGAGLIPIGLAIALNFMRRPAAFLLGCMIFIWMVVLHAPRGFDDIVHHRVFEFSRTFGALAFSSTAFVIAGRAGKGRKLPEAQV